MNSFKLLQLWLVLGAFWASAQPTIGLSRYNDDFAALKNDTLKKGVDRLKYIPVGRGNFASLGGELREQVQHYDNLNFGDVLPGYDDNPVQLWHRLMLHADIGIGDRWRLFFQLNNTMRFFNGNPAAAEIDENQLSLHQAFAELKVARWKFRLGQQEMFFGSHRLITFREGPNTRQAFDGLTVKRSFASGSLDFFAVSKVISMPYVFDDESMHDGLIGIYGTQYLLNGNLGLDYFFVNFESRSRMYNYQTGYENRQTCGIRAFSNYTLVNFEVEGAYQTGKFNQLAIAAYSAFADVNLTVIASKKAVVGFAANVASGDKSASDNELNTYNLLYAKPAFGLAAPVGATNIVSFNPYVKINPLAKLSVLAEVFFLSRNSADDGTYSPAMAQNRPRPDLIYASNKKTLGRLYVLETNYRENKNLSFALDASFFKPGAYPRQTGSGKSITYLSFKSTYRF